MPSKSESANLKPPASVMKIAGFLSEIQKRQTLGEKYDVGDIWNKFSISVSHIDGFMNWLHVDRKEAVPLELDLAHAPDKTLAKKPERQEDPGEEFSPLDAQTVEAGEQPINVHLWNALFKSESKRRRREMPQSRLQASASRVDNFAKGYNGNLLLSNLSLTQAGGPQSPNTESPQVALPQHLTNGLSAQAFSDQITEKTSPVTPVWNEPIRRDLMPTLVSSGSKGKSSQEGETTERAGTFGKVAAVASLLPFGLMNAPGVLPNQLIAPLERFAEPKADMLFGQITLVAPPLQVSPELGQGASMGLTFDWKDMAKGAGQVDYAGLVTLAQTLPEGSKVLYPAIHPRQLGSGAVNLRLEPTFAEGLAAQGYGGPSKIDGRKSASLASNWLGGTPAVSLLPATISPLKGPRRRLPGVGADNLPQGNVVAPAEDPKRRMRFIDYLGLPIYLSPQLNTSPDLEQETRARITTEFMPRAPLISPFTFSQLRSQMLGGFYGVEAKPELGAWRRAAPDYDRFGLSIAGLLSSRIRGGGMGDGVVSPSAPIPRSSAMPTTGSLGSRFGPISAPKLSGAALAARTPLHPSPYTPPSMPAPSFGIPAQGESQRMVRPATISSPAPVSTFRPTIPTAAAASTAPSGQASTAPTAAGHGSSSLHLSPQITVAPEKPTSPVRAMATKPVAPTTSAPSASTPTETPKVAPPALMTPQSQMPRPVSTPKSQIAKPAAMAPAIPVGNKEVPGPSQSSLKPPQMLIAPPKPVSGPKMDEPLAVQTSASGSGGGTTGESANNRSAEVAEKKESALPGSEINLLANEVWILLKRKLAFEAQRAGR